MVTPKRRWKLDFYGREKGAIGHYQRNVLVVEAATADEAWVKVYDTHDPYMFSQPVEMEDEK